MMMSRYGFKKNTSVIQGQEEFDYSAITNSMMLDGSRKTNKFGVGSNG
jgi:hypothetical protein|tara:strand:+ start:230 stop:373 length:144 start_codon:yes stop_codon:yes gene_type:complete